MANKPTGNPVGRPTVMSPEIYRKIEEAAANDCTVEEIALYAGVHRSTLYKWMQEDQELSDRITELRETPMLKARKTIINALEDPNHAFRYAERKRPKEWMPTSKVEHAGTVSVNPRQELDPKMEAIKERYEAELQATLSAGLEEEPIKQSNGDGTDVVMKTLGPTDENKLAKE